MSDIIGRLRSLDSGAVSDAIDRVGHGHVVTTLRPLSVRTRVVGRAVTVRLGPPQQTPTSRHLCTAAVEAAGRGDVIVIAHQGRTDCAGWGGILSRAAATRGIEGTFVDGAARDVDEAADIGYPVYATAATPRTARGRTQEHAWGETVDFSGVRIAPGDYIVADSSGIAIVPAAAINDVLTVATEIAAREADMAAAVARGVPVSTVMGGDYERLLEGPM